MINRRIFEIMCEAEIYKLSPLHTLSDVVAWTQEYDKPALVTQRGGFVALVVPLNPDEHPDIRPEAGDA